MSQCKNRACNHYFPILQIFISQWMHSREQLESISVRHFLSNLTVRVLLLCSQAIGGESALPLIMQNFDITRQTCFMPPTPACFAVTEVMITDPSSHGALLNGGTLICCWSSFRCCLPYCSGFAFLRLKANSFCRERDCGTRAAREQHNAQLSTRQD